MSGRAEYMKKQPGLAERLNAKPAEIIKKLMSLGVFATINQRRGMIVSSVEDGAFARVDAEVPLSCISVWREAWPAPGLAI